MWLILAFISAALLGFYDVFKKQALNDNAVIPVLCINTLCASLLFLPLILLSGHGMINTESLWYVPRGNLTAHGLIILKSFIVLSSWMFGYFGIKHLPITIVGPINATRPVMVLVGAMLFMGETLNGYQWIGVLLAFSSFMLLNRSGKKEGIDFSHNKWILCVVLAAVAGAISGLYDKYLLSRLAPMFVQSWFNLYQAIIMAAILMILWWPRRKKDRFQWRWAIVMIPILLSAADFAYFYALSDPESMISVVSMIRRGSVIVSFTCGALVFREKNLQSKAWDLGLVLLGMVFLYIGSR